MQTLKHLHEKISRDKTAVFTFGRMNPPTIGHEKLINKIKDVANKHRADWFVYLSSSQDSKKNPLSFDRKIFYARKMFGRDVNQKNFPKEPTALHAASSLHDKGYKKLVMVVGSDRVGQFEKLMKQYNGVDNKPHGYYNFDTIDVVSAGERDPDAEGVEGMSASKLRGFAVKGNFLDFKDGLPGLSEKDARSLFNEIRKGLKLQAISEKLKVEESVRSQVTIQPIQGVSSSRDQKKYKELYRTRKLKEDVKDNLMEKAKKTGIAFLSLKGVYERAEREWDFGHKVGILKETFAMDKVNEHILNSKEIKDINENFKEWLRIAEADVVVSSPTGTYVTKASSVGKKKQEIKNKFRRPEDRKSVVVKRATSTERRYMSRQDEETVHEMMSRPHVFVGVKDTDPTSNLRPTVSYTPGKSKDFIKIKPVDTDFFNENLKELVSSPYEFLQELGLHINFGILIRDKGNEKKMVDAIAKKKSFITSGYYDNISYAVGTNENSLRKALENSQMYESVIQEKAVSKQQQKFFGLVRAIQKGKASGSPEAEKAARDMSKKDVEDFASTKHKGLPKKVQSESDLNKRIKELRNKPVKEDEDLKKVAKELAGASKMHMGQSKRISKFLKKSMKEDYEFDAETLLQQLGGRKFIAMTGAKDLMVDRENKSLHMKIGRNSKGINHLKITYMPDDTYTMDFGRIRKLDYKVVRSISGVYAEALQDVFTEVTGMYTSL